MLINTYFIHRNDPYLKEDGRLTGFFRTEDGKYLVSLEVYEQMHSLGLPIDVITISEEGRAEGVRIESATQDESGGTDMFILKTVPIPHSGEVAPEYLGAWALPSGGVWR